MRREPPLCVVRWCRCGPVALGPGCEGRWGLGDGRITSRLQEQTPCLLLGGVQGQVSSLVRGAQGGAGLPGSSPKREPASSRRESASP